MRVNALVTVQVTNRGEAHLELNAFRRKYDCALVISGDSLEVCLRYYEHEFVELACQCPAVVCCRCSPTQKAQIVTLLQQHTANRTCAIGDCYLCPLWVGAKAIFIITFLISISVIHAFDFMCNR